MYLPSRLPQNDSVPPQVQGEELPSDCFVTVDSQLVTTPFGDMTCPCIMWHFKVVDNWIENTSHWASYALQTQIWSHDWVWHLIVVTVLTYDGEPGSGTEVRITMTHYGDPDVRTSTRI